MENNHWDLQQHGDLVERGAHDFIMEYLPAYEENWKLFIGRIIDRIGVSRPAFIKSRQQGVVRDGEGIMEEGPWRWDNISRLKFAVYHYSILETIYSMYLRTSVSMPSAPENGTEAEWRNWHLTNTNEMLLVAALIGRLRDLVERAGLAIRWMPNFAGQIDEDYQGLHQLYQERNLVLHYARPFLSVDTLGLRYVPLVEEQLDDEVWDGKAKPDAYIYLQDYWSKSFGKAARAVGNILYRFNSRIHSILSDYDSVLCSPNEGHIPWLSSESRQGFKYEHGILGFPLASGMSSDYIITTHLDTNT